MLFHSGSFLLFFVLVTILYYSVPRRYRNFILLLASYVFYCSWEIKYSLLLIFVTVTSYFFALKIEKCTTTKSKKKYLYGYIIIALGLLFFFKYFNFFNDNMRSLSSYFNIRYPISYLVILLPIGISFFTFEAISYILDVYHQKRPPEKSFLSYALFISFFPKLLAGPIERSTTLLPQLEMGKQFEYTNLTAGIKRVIWGLFKKVVIADRISTLIDGPFTDPTGYDAPTLLFVSYLFLFQIYCDFSGYTDIAIGTARILGFRLMENFDIPFISKSILEFWRRWHISLSSWLRDNLYSPLLLAFTRKSFGVFALVLSTFITFILIGLWHGDRWNYVLFGFFQFVAISYEILTVKKKKFLSKKLSPRFYNTICMLIAFHYTVLSFIFIKVETPGNAFSAIKRILNWNLSHTDFNTYTREVGLHPLQFSMALLILFIFIDKPVTRIVKGASVIKLDTVLYAFLAACVLLFGVFHHSKFIYFQF